MRDATRPLSLYWLGQVGAGFRMGPILLSLMLANGCSDPAVEGKTPSGHQSLEKKFEGSMSGVVLEGFFKTNQPDSELRPEKYSISKVSKLAGDYWIFQSRIQYGEHDVTLPVPVTIRFAGDTPVLTFDETTIPGLGTFSARVLFFDDYYVGIWRHGEHSGQHFGRIIPQAAP